MAETRPRRGSGAAESAVRRATPSLYTSAPDAFAGCAAEAGLRVNTTSDAIAGVQKESRSSRFRANKSVAGGIAREVWGERCMR